MKHLKQVVAFFLLFSFLISLSYAEPLDDSVLLSYYDDSVFW